MTETVKKEKRKEPVKDAKLNKLVALPPKWPLWMHLEKAAEFLKTTVEWLEIQMDVPYLPYTAERAPGPRIEEFLYNRKKEQLTQILSSLEKAASARLTAHRKIWEGEASQWAEDPDAIFVQYPEWGRKDAEEPDDDEKEKNVKIAIEIVARLRSLTLKQYIDFILKQKLHANVCGHTAGKLEQMLGYKGDLRIGKETPDYANAKSLGRILKGTAGQKKLFCCRIDVGPHAFVLEYRDGNVMLYQSWLGNYTLAQRLPVEKKKEYNLNTFVDTLEKAAEKNDGQAQENLFGIKPMDMKKKKTRKYRMHTEIPGDAQIQDNIKKMWAENEKEWDARLASDDDIRFHLSHKYDSAKGIFCKVKE
jgi:hypothetical protein